MRNKFTKKIKWQLTVSSGIMKEEEVPEELHGIILKIVEIIKKY